MLRRSCVGAIAALVAIVLGTTPVSAQVGPFDPPQTVAGGCESFFGDAVVTAGGETQGFATCVTSSGLRIRYFSRAAGGTVNPSVNTGFVGNVLGVAHDSTGTYVLFNNDTQILIGKRTNAGAFNSRVVDTFGGGGLFPTGDVIARDGQWFGVWSKQVGPGGEFAQTELFQGGTVFPVRRLTTTSGNVDDLEPSLAYSGTTPVMVWTRCQSPAVPGPSDIWLAKFTGGTWQSRVLASAGFLNYLPDLQVSGGVAAVTWNRDDRVVVASNPTGSFTSHTFNTLGIAPKVAASISPTTPDDIFVSWTAFGPVGGDDRVFFAETASSSVTGTWHGTHIAPAGTFSFAVGAAGGKAIVAYQEGSTVRVRAQT
jgi:hypothetical protein